MNKAAVFLDRDGTIIKDVGYINNPQDVEFFEESFSALLKLQKRFILFIITSQSGISKGFTTETEVKLVNEYVVETLKSKGVYIEYVYCCPHSNEDNCICKKPKPYFIHQAEKQYQLDLNNSYIIGDHPSDSECGINAGITPIYLLTGHGEKHRHELNNDVMICKNILEAANIINKKNFKN